MNLTVDITACICVSAGMGQVTCVLRDFGNTVSCQIIFGNWNSYFLGGFKWTIWYFLLRLWGLLFFYNVDLSAINDCEAWGVEA